MALVCKPFGDIITFTRASTATYFDSSGVLTSAAIDAPRTDYNPSTLAAQGLLIEEARTNLYTYSQTIQSGVGTWAVSRASTVANAIVGLDGTLTASKLQEDTTAANSHYLYSISQAYTSGTVYTQSVYVKAAGRTQIQMSFPSGAFTTELRVLYDLTAVTATVQTGSPTGTITAVGNGWYRCTITATATTTASANTIIVYLFNGTLSYNGDGTSGVFIWGAQLEAGAFPTSYIPTTTTALTRSADVASVNTLSPWYSATEGTLYSEATFTNTVSFNTTAALGDGTASNSMRTIQWNNGTDRIWQITKAGAAEASFAGTGQVGTAKFAGAYKLNDVNASKNGSIGITDTTATIPTVNALWLGATGSANFVLNGWLRRVSYYPRRLSDAELQAITA